MKEAIVDTKGEVRIIDSPIPEPGDNEVLIKVVVSGSNPKDWKVEYRPRPPLPPCRYHLRLTSRLPPKVPMWMDLEHNSGDDIAGTIAALGCRVTTFAPGQRVAAFHVMRAPHGSYAEYAVAPAHTTFALPAHTSFEEAVALPLAAMTAAVGLFVRLGLPEPWTAGAEDGKREAGAGPLIVYGAASVCACHLVAGVCGVDG